MIALCRLHADMADGGAYEDGYLRGLKAGSTATEVSGQLAWMRRELLAVVGGNFYFEQPVIFSINGQQRIWFNRDDDGYLLLNFDMPSMSGEPRIVLRDNFFTVSTNVDDIECPPQGRRLAISYKNGDRFAAQFFEIENAAALVEKYPDADQFQTLLPFPLTCVELWQTAAGTCIEFGPKETKLPGALVQGGFFSRNAVAGIGVRFPPDEVSRLFPDFPLLETA